jgi:O-antigen/teichoic acid export membrane protein
VIETTANGTRPAESAWIATGFVVQLAAQVVRTVILARLLASHDLGVYFVLRSVGGVATLMAPVGLGQVGLRHVASARTPVAARSAVRHTLRIALGASGVVIPVAWLTMRAAGLSAVDSTLAAAMIAALTWSALFADLGRGTGRVSRIAGIEKVFGSFADLVGLLGVLAVVGRADLTTALGVTAITAALPVGWLAIELRQAFRGRPSPAVSSGNGGEIGPRELLKEGWPVAANALLWRALTEIDLWIVAGLTDPDRTAVYGVATRLALPLELPKTIAIYQLSPLIAALHSRGEREILERRLKVAARLASAGCLSLVVALMLLGPNGINALFGAGYARAMPPLLVLAVGQVVNVAAGLGGTTLLMTGHSRTLLQISIFSTSLGAIMAVVSIPILGLLGAAAASTIGRSVQSLLMVRAVRRYADVSVHAGPRLG